MSLTTIYGSYFVVEGGRIFLRTSNSTAPTIAAAIKAVYIPTVDTFPSQFDEDLIEEVILIMGRGNTNG